MKYSNIEANLSIAVFIGLMGFLSWIALSGY